MKAADVFERVPPEQLVKGDRVIAINNTGHLPGALIEETFRRIEIEEAAGTRWAVLGKRSDESRLALGRATAPSNWRFYRKQARS